MTTSVLTVPAPLSRERDTATWHFSYVQHEARASFFYMNDPSARIANSTAQSEEEVIAHTQTLESYFVTNADHSHMDSYLASHLARLVSLKLFLVMQYPIHPCRPTSSERSGDASTQQPRWTKVSRESMLQTAVSILELSERLLSSPYKERYMWWNETYVQWHPLAVTLAELCIQTRGTLVERAGVAGRGNRPAALERDHR